MGTGGPFPGAKRGRGVTMSTHTDLVPRSRTSRSYTSSPPPPNATKECSRTAFVFYIVYIVTHSGYSIRDGTLLHSKSQYTTVKHSQQLLEHTYTSDRTSCGNLPTLTPILAIRKLPYTSRDNQWSGYRSSCTPQRHLGTSLTCHLPAPTIGCLHSNDSKIRLSLCQ
jgi:hypothetical protein